MRPEQVSLSCTCWGPRRPCRLRSVTVLSRATSILFFRSAYRALEESGIAPEKIVIDPGIGFGKTFDQNLTLINRLDFFKPLGKAILVGPSRKAFLGKILEEPVAARRDIGTLGAITAAVLRGASIVRVHHVPSTVQVCRVADAVLRERVWHMILGVGVDLVDVRRMERALNCRWGKRFVAKVFSEEEIAACRNAPQPAQGYAARFAAKEALAKALGTGFSRGVSPSRIVVRGGERRQPSIAF